jgi:hypothetical protein
MTEAEWKASSDPLAMLNLLHETGKYESGKATDRRVRLWACGFCRHLWHLLEYDDSRRAVETAERFADGIADTAEAENAFHSALAIHQAIEPEELSSRTLAELTVWVAAMAAHPFRYQDNAVIETTRIAALGGAPAALEARRLACELLRCIFGHPFRTTATRNPRWRTPAVLGLARGMYDDRSFERMSALADALESAGCADAELLGHLRSEGPHVRGCWALDVVLGKA